ncbi:hypothetical protein HJFPF1_11541 [Paramyrothecium foliicola]|nr:hypothetical protein HJFPF1_11541 [Paramyrothecium foliicola]
MRSSIFVPIALALSTSAATLAERPRDAALSVFATVPDTPNLENLALRQNGDIVVTSSGSGTLHVVDSSGSRVAAIADIPGASALLGIATLEKDVFYVAGANLTGLTPIAVGTNAVWKVDLRGLKVRKDNTLSKPAKVSLVTEIPSAGLLNGMTRLSPKDNSRLLLSDSALGQILLLNVNTKEYETILDDETTAGRPERLVAVNGLRTYGQDLFYVNLVRNLFAKVPISTSTGHPTGPSQIIVNGTVPFADDFALSSDGKRAWIALSTQNVIVEVDILAQTSAVLVNSTKLGVGTSVAIIPGTLHSSSLYVTGSSAVENATVGTGFRVDSW